MNRNLKTQALVLKNYRIGDFHKGTILLTGSLGIIHAIAHGAYKGKSRLGNNTDVFNALIVYLYHDPVKNSYKITDVECNNYFAGVKRHLHKIYIAYLISEIVWKTYGGGGDFDASLSLVQEAFRCLDTVEAARADRVLIQFLWRYLPMAGHYLQITVCTKCDRTLEKGDPVYFSHSEQSFVCSRCAGNRDQYIPPGCGSYIRYTSPLPLEKSIEASLEGGAEKILKGLLIHLVEGIVETGLQTLDSGGGFF